MRLTRNGAAFSDERTPHDRDRAVELGVNHIDTAAFCFSPLRSANELINRALGPYPDDLVITTKVGPGRGPSGDWTDWARPEQLRGRVQENRYGIGERRADSQEVMRMCGELGIAFVPFYATRAPATRPTWRPVWRRAPCGSPRSASPPERT